MSARIELDEIIAFYESLTPASLGQLERLYAPDARFKDPFNDVQGVTAICRIFEHMFETLASPRFRVTARVADTGGAVLIWDFQFELRGADISIRGASHLLFDDAGRVLLHRDYWDAAEELYARLPLLGWLMRRLQRALRTPQPFV